MSNGFDPRRVQGLIDTYRGNPMLFTDDQLDELEQLAQQVAIPFKRIENNFDLKRTAEIAVGGMFEGLTTIPLGPEPRNSYEAIAHSIGHLIGFAPAITSIPLRGLAKGASKLGLKGVQRGLESGALSAQVVNKYSVPMFFGDRASSLVNKGIAKAGLETMEFMKHGAGARGVLDQAIHLGTASAVSSIWGGPDQILNSMIHGSLAGGAFGGLGNFTRIGKMLKSTNVNNHKQAEQMIKAGIGSMITGLPTTLQGHPIEMQLYQYLLGGFFGYTARPSHEREGQKFWAESMSSGSPDTVFYPEKNPEWKNMSIKTKDYINEQVENQARITLGKTQAWGDGDPLDIKNSSTAKKIQNFLYDLAKSRHGREPTKEEIRTIAKEQAGDLVYDSITVNLAQFEEPLPERGEDPRQGLRGQILVEIFPDGTIRAKSRKGDYWGARMDEKVPVDIEGKDLGAPAENFDGRRIGTIKYINTRGDKNREQGFIVANKPFAVKKVNWETGTVEEHVTKEDWYNIEHHLNSKNMYIDGGVKDKGILKVSEYHTDAKQISIEQIIDTLARGQLKSLPNVEQLSKTEQHLELKKFRQEITESFNDSLQKEFEWFGDALETQQMKDTVTANHERQWKSNVLWEAQRHDLYRQGGDERGFTEIGRLMEPEIGARNVVDRNKREQLMHTKSMPVNFNIDGKNTLNIAVLNDWVPDIKEHPDMYYKDSNGIDRPYGSETDGSIYFRHKVFDDVINKSGYIDPNTKEVFKDLMIDAGMLKPVITSRLGTDVLLVKSAGRKASDAMNRFMEANGLDVIVMNSAAKHKGRIRGNDYDFENGEYKLKDPSIKLDTRPIPVSDLRLDLGVYENTSKSIKPQLIVRQLFGNTNEEQFPKGFVDFVFKEIYEPLINGDPIVNKSITSYLKDPNTKIDLKKINVDDISIENIHKIIQGDNDLATKVRNHILKADTERQDAEPDLNFTDDAFRDYVYRNMRVVNTVGATSAVAYEFKHTSKMFKDAYKRYVIDRYLRPRWKYSGKGWLAPYDVEYIKGDKKLKSGEFMADDNHKNFPVKIDMDLFKEIPKDLFKQIFPNYKKGGVTLGNLMDAKERIQDPSVVNQLKSSGKYSKVNKAINDAFDFMVIRVPADSASGARVLRFKGFTGRKGNALITHPRDDAYLGGADKDSDSAFMYHGFDKKILKAYRDLNSEWEKDGRVIDGKSRELDSRFSQDENNKAYETKASIFSPSMRKTVAKNVFHGNHGIGWAINNRVAIQSLIDSANANKGKLSVPVYTKAGKLKGTYSLELKPNGGYEMRKLAREMLNRSADAGNYPSMISYVKFPQMLFDSAFTGKFKPEAWFKKYAEKQGFDIESEIKYSDIKSSAAGDVAKMVSSFKPNAKSKKKERRGQAMEFDEFQVLLKEHGRSEHPALISKLANKAHKDGVGDLIFTRLYDNNIKLVNQLNILLTKDILAREMSGFTIAGLSTNLQKAKINAIESGDWKQLNDYLMKENTKIASFLALVKKGHQIEKEILDAGGSREKVIRNLKRITAEADNLKLKYKNVDRRNDEGPTKSKFPDFDAEYKNLKSNLPLELEKDSDVNIYLGFLDQYMLSPFVKGEKFGYWSRVPWQSTETSSKSIKDFFVELDKVGKLAALPEETQTPQINKFIDYMHQPSSFNKINESFAKVDKRFVEFEGKPLVGGEKFEASVERLKQHMSEHPFWSQHPEDAFYEFTSTFEVAGRDFSTITRGDIGNLLRYFEYYNPKNKRSWIDQMVNDNFPNTKARDPMRVQRIFYYNRPITLDKKTAAYEAIVFGEMNAYVKTSDGVVIKKVKKVLSTHGGIKDWLSKMVTQTENEATIVHDKMDKDTYKTIVGLTPNERVELFNNVIDVMEGKISKESLKDYFKKEFTVVIDPETKEKKTWSGKQMFDSLTTTVKNDLESFSKEYIHEMRNKVRLSENEGEGWKQLDKDIASKSLVRLNEYMIWKNGIFDYDNFHRKVIKPVWEGKPVPKNLPMESILRAQYEYMLSKKAAVLYSPSDRSNKKQYSINDRKDNPFIHIGIIDRESYFPHVWRERIGKSFTKAEKAELDKYFNDKVQSEYNKVLSTPKLYSEWVTEITRSLPAMSKMQQKKLDIILKDYKSTGNKEELNKIIKHNIGAIVKYENDAFSHSTLFGEKHMFDATFDVNWDRSLPEIQKTLKDIGFYSRTSNLLERDSNIPSYMREYEALKAYKESIVKSRLKNLGSLMANAQIDGMMRNKPFGKHTKAHAELYRMYLRDVLGYRTTFSEWVLEAMHNSDPLKLKKNMYYGTSDHNMIKQLDRIANFFGGSLPFRIPRAEKARHEYFSRLIHKYGALEAQFQLLTLLANTGTATGNLFGGSLNTITKTGMRNFTRAANFKWLKKNLLFDVDGTPLLYLKNNTPVETKADLKKWLVEKGVIEQYIRNELEVNPKVKSIKNQRAVKQFAEDFIQLLKRNPSPNKATIKELADRYNIWDAIVEAGAFPMQASEVWLRNNSFLSHLLQQRDAFHGMAGEIDINNQAFIDQALRGVEATQFVYHSVGRSAFMRTATGKVLTRFKNFVQNQIGFQREIYKQARMYGFEKGTKPYEDFERLFIINAMLMALGAAFTYSLFDTVTPPPFDWMREMAELLYGDRKERERAFYGTYPRAIAPLQIATPPIARVPQSLAMVLNGDWDRFTDYYIYTLFPFGRVARSLDKTFDEPYGTTFGRGMQQFFRIPTDKFVARYDKAQLEKMRKEYIENNIDEMSEDLGNEWDNKEN